MNICRICGFENISGVTRPCHKDKDGYHYFDPIPESVVCEHNFDGDLENRYMVCEKKKFEKEIAEWKEAHRKLNLDLMEKLNEIAELRGKLEKCAKDFEAIKGYAYEGQTGDKFLDGMNARQKTINELCEVALKDIRK